MRVSTFLLLLIVMLLSVLVALAVDPGFGRLAAIVALVALPVIWVLDARASKRKARDAERVPVMSRR